jgi:hypothetical protein
MSLLHYINFSFLSYSSFIEQPARKSNFTAEEILLCARAYMIVSEDPATGTDHKSAAFWIRIHSTHNKLMAQSNNNKIHNDHPEYTHLPENCTVDALKSFWYKRI